MMDVDKIAASAPMDATAAKVTGKGESWTPRVKLQDWYDDPPKMYGPEYFAKHADPKHFSKYAGMQNWRDFRGVEIGRLKVIGVMIKDEKSHTPASWVCRCKCGCYCTRTAKSLRIGIIGGNSFVPMCGRCTFQANLARGWLPKKSLEQHPMQQRSKP
jgi:hypothetical protein